MNSHSFVNLHEATQMLMTVNYVRKMTESNPVGIADIDCLSICSSCLFSARCLFFC